VTRRDEFERRAGALQQYRKPAAREKLARLKRKKKRSPPTDSDMIETAALMASDVQRLDYQREGLPQGGSPKPRRSFPCLRRVQHSKADPVDATSFRCDPAMLAQVATSHRLQRGRGH